MCHNPIFYLRSSKERRISRGILYIKDILKGIFSLNGRFVKGPLDTKPLKDLSQTKVFWRYSIEKKGSSVEDI